jgi:hypothetical protein
VQVTAAHLTQSAVLITSSRVFVFAGFAFAATRVAPSEVAARAQRIDGARLDLRAARGQRVERQAQPSGESPGNA